MVRKLFRMGNDLAVALPAEVVKRLDLHEGSEVRVESDPDGQCILLALVGSAAAAAAIDAGFARQLEEFIEQYRPALVSLAR